MANMFDENGNYNKTEWKPGDRITAGKLNKIEESLEAINNNDIERHVEADNRLDILEYNEEVMEDRVEELEDLVEDNKTEVDTAIYEVHSKMDRLEQEMNDGIDTVEAIAHTVDDKIADADASMKAQVAEVEGDLEGLHAKDEELSEQLAHKANKTFINVSEFGTIGDGMTDDSSAFQEAIEYATQHNMSVYVPNGEYLIKDIVVDNSLTLTLDDNAVIIKANGYKGIIINYNYSDVQYVTNIDKESNNVISITLNDTSMFEIGDIVKVVSDDIIEYSNNEEYISSYGSTLLNGQMFEVFEISSNSIKCFGNLRGDWTTNIRIGIQTKKTFNLSGGKFLSKDSDVANPSIQVIGGINHNIKTSMVDNYQGKCVELVSTYGATVFVDAGRADNSTYAICDRSSSKFNVSYNCKSLRHGFTTLHRLQSKPNNYLYSYGESENGIINNVFASGTSQAVADTHEQGYNIYVNNVTSVDNNNKTLQNRCGYITYNNINSINNNSSFYFYSGTTKTIKNVTVNNSNLNGGVIGSNNNVTFNKTIFNINKSKAIDISGDNVNVTFNDCIFYSNGFTDSQTLFRNYSGINRKIFLNNCKIIFKNTQTDKKINLYLLRDLEQTTYYLALNNLEVYSESDGLIQFRAFRQNDSYNYEGTKLYIKNFYCDKTLNLSMYNNDNTYETFSGSMKIDKYPGLMFEYIE